MRISLILTTLALLGAGTLNAAQAASTLQSGVLKIGMEGTYPPFTYMNDQNQLVGFDVDIAKAVAQKLGLKPEFVLTEWSGILAGLQSNKYDVIVNQVGVTAERQKNVAFSTPYAYSNAQVIVRKNSSDTYKSLADLKGKRVGVGLGSNYEKMLRDAGGINVVTYPGASEYLRDLAVGRIDAALNDRLLVGYLAKSQNLPVKGAGIIDDAQPIAVAIKKSNTALKTQIDRALLQLKADGTYAKISRQWFGQDVSKK